MKTYLITGGAQGIGQATVELLLTNPDVALIVIDKQRTDFIDNCLAQYADRFSYYLQDIAERENLSEVLKEIAQRRLNGIVNVAGEVYLEKWDEMKLATWDRTLAVNLTAPLQIVHELRNALESNASIVNIASTDGTCAGIVTIAYAASKAGLMNLTKSLGAVLGEKGIRVNAIAPGWVETKMTEGTLPDESIELTPLKRNAKAQEVANLVEYLLSEKSSFISGETIAIDGGLSTIDYTIFKEVQRSELF